VPVAGRVCVTGGPGPSISPDYNKGPSIMSTRDQILQLKQRMGESIIGQEQVIERLLLTLLANGNLLLEGLPGLAKTRAVKSLARNLESEFRPETVTYICEHPGQFTLPALVIPWWDLKNQQLMRVTLPAVTLEVEPGPVQSTDTTAPSAAAPGRWWLWWTLGAMLLLVATCSARRVRPAFLHSCSMPVTPTMPKLSIMPCSAGWMRVIVVMRRRPSTPFLPTIRARTCGSRWKCFRRLSWGETHVGTAWHWLTACARRGDRICGGVARQKTHGCRT
jgi:MoxR-vWA-beta-propeller ternary system protein